MPVASIRVLMSIPRTRADAAERNDEQLVPVDPFSYVTPLGKVFRYAHELFQVSDTGLVHNLRSKDMNPKLASSVCDGCLQDVQRLLWHRSRFFSHPPNNLRQNPFEHSASSLPEEEPM